MVVESSSLHSAGLIIRLATLFFAFPSLVDASTYYVASTMGSDSNPGTITAPWATLRKATLSVHAGDTVILRGGTFVNQAIGNEGTSGGTCTYGMCTGTSTAPITFAAYPGETPVISHGTGTPSGIYLKYGQSYIVIDGITFDACERMIGLYGTTQITIKNCTFSDYPQSWGDTGWTTNQYIIVASIVAGYNGPAGTPTTFTRIQNCTFTKVGWSVPRLTIKCTNGVTTAGSPVVTSATANFTQSDLLQYISGTGIPPNTYIGLVNSPHSISLSSDPRNNVPVNALSSNAGVTISEQINANVGGPNFGFFHAYSEQYPGPDLQNPVPLTVKGPWDGSTTYALNDVVTYFDSSSSLKYSWKSLQDNNTGHAPAVGSFYWSRWSQIDDTSYNLVENCTFSYPGHHALSAEGHHNVFRNNLVIAEGWVPGNQYYVIPPPPVDQTPLNWGGRGIALNGFPAYLNLVENNRIGYADKPCIPHGANGIEITARYNIVRNNYIYGVKEAGIMLIAEEDTANAVSQVRGNHVYNNTIYNCGTNAYGSCSINSRYLTRCQSLGDYQGGINFNAFGSGRWNPINNVIKNNIISRVPTGHVLWYLSTARLSDQVIVGNFMDRRDPEFLDPTMGRIFDRKLPDLRLANASPCKNAGVFLTMIKSAPGSGTSFVVDDAGYFHDDYKGLISPDTIRTSAGQSATIASINYDTNTITVSSPISWKGGDRVALDFSGSAPDQGVNQSSLLAPTNLHVASP